MGDINNNGDTQFHGCFCALAENFSAIWNILIEECFYKVSSKSGFQIPVISLVSPNH